MHKGDPIYVVGHSMGAAVATLCALDLQFTFGLGPSDVRLYTYGSPRVGNQQFAEFVARKLPVRARGWLGGVGLPEPACGAWLPASWHAVDVAGRLAGRLCWEQKLLQYLLWGFWCLRSRLCTSG